MSDTHSISDWVKAARAGDRESFGRLVEAYSGAVLAAAYSRLGDVSAAEDIRQDAFLLAFERLESLRQPNRFGAWIRAIAVNLCRHWQRSQAYRRRLLENAAVREHESADDASDVLAQREVQGVLEKAMERLAPADREAIMLFYFEGESIREAARFAGIGEAAMRKRLERARHRLRDALSDEAVAELRSYGRDRKAARGVLLALPGGSTFGQFANGASVAPSAFGLALRASLETVAGKAVVAGLCASAVVAAAAFIVAPDADDSALTPTAAVETEEASSTDASPAANTPAENEPVTVAQSAAVSNDGDSRPPLLPYVAGRVINENGEPVAGATVEACVEKAIHERATPERKVLGSATTGEDGSFVIDGLENDAFAVVATHPDWAIGAATVWLSDEHPAQRDLEIALARRGMLTGEVRNPGGRHVEGAVVAVYYAYPPPEPRREAGRNWEVIESFRTRIECGAIATAVTDESGAFSIEGLPDGFVARHIVAFKDGFAPSVYWGKEAPASWLADDDGDDVARNWREGAALIGESEVALTLRQGVTVAGTVIDGDTKRPVSSATVNAVCYEGEGHGFSSWLYASATTNGEGNYELSDVPPVRAGVYAVFGEKESAGAAIDLTNARGTMRLDLAVKRTGSVEGTVVDASTGLPLSGINVFSAEPNVFLRGKRTKTDDDGQFRIDGLPASALDVSVYESGPNPGEWKYEMDQASHPNMQHGSLALDLKAGETREEFVVYMAKRQEDEFAYPFEVQVVNGNGHGVGGAIIYYDLLNARSVTADENGHHTFERLMRGTLAAINPETEAIGTAQVFHEPGQAGEPVTIVTDTPSGKISGKVSMADGSAPPSGFAVTFQLGMNVRLRSSIERDGTYESILLAPDEWQVGITESEKPYMFEPRSQRVEVAAEQTISGIDFTLIPMEERVAGVVRRRDGSAVNGVVVKVYGEGVYRYGSTDSSGRFSLGPLAGGNLFIEVGDPPDANGVDKGDWMMVSGVEAGTEDLELVLPVAGRLTGRVLLSEEELALMSEPGRQRHVLEMQLHRKDLAEPVYGHHNFWDVYLWQPAFSVPLEPGVYDVKFSTYWAEATGDADMGEIVIESGMVTDLGDVALER